MTTSLTKVEKIHSEFKLALNSAQIIIKEIPESKEINDSILRLRNLGLTKSKTFKKFSEKNSDNATQIANNKLAKELLKIETMFPQYRLIGFKKTIEICEKYNLFLTELKNFTGIIPNKNLLEIEKHKENLTGKFISADYYMHSINDFVYNIFINGMKSCSVPKYIIVAPESDIDDNLTKIGRMLIDFNIPKFKLKFNMDLTLDPVVLSPIYVSDEQIIFQIVTAWGPEADDDYITNQIKVDNTNN